MGGAGGNAWWDFTAAILSRPQAFVNAPGPSPSCFVHYAAAFADLELRAALALRGMLSMCTLKELDVQSRAAVSLVEEWQGEHEAVREIWKLEDVIELIITAITGSEEVRARIINHNHGRILSGEPRKVLLYTLSYALDALRRLTVAVDGVARVIAMFESQGYDVGRASELKEKRKVLPDIVKSLESFHEEVEWQELEHTAPPSSTIRAVADYLKSTGQASA